MKAITISLTLLLTLVGCGGTAPAPTRGPDEVTATWTAGDDVPLGDPGSPAPAAH